MDRTQWWTVVIVSSLLSVHVMWAQCPYQECYCDGTRINCQNKNLQAVPRLLPSNIAGIQTIMFDNNHITFIPDGSLPPNVQEITLQNNPISDIDDSAFDGSVSTLTTLFFSRTHLVKIPSALGRLKALTFLSIFGANITDWNDEAMRNIGQTLQSLQFENVGFTSWPSWFQYCSHLNDVTMSGGLISAVPDDAMDNLVTSLTRLVLSGNKIITVPKAFSKLKNLQELYLDKNAITDLTWQPHQSPLVSLSLSDNRISNASHLSQFLLPFAGTLTFLDIDKNRLSAFPDFAALTKVGSLDFSNNRIFDPLMGSFSNELYSLGFSHNLLAAVPRVLLTLYSITDIYLSYNSIQLIQSTDFHNQTKYIDLGYNQISQLTDSSFPTNSSIMYLQLNNNPLSQISNVALSNLPNLAELNLQNTLITRLPLGLASLTKLITFDVSSCTRLVCTCQEKSLQSWILTSLPEFVHGRCGLVAVYDFLTIYSKLCP